MDTTNKFDGYAGDYTVGRPGYAKELIDSLYSTYKMSEDSIIADIGSGTGKFARHLLEKGSRASQSSRTRSVFLICSERIRFVFAICPGYQLIGSAEFSIRQLPTVSYSYIL